MDGAVYSVLVFMSTYNGEQYLDEQINTILNQKDVNIRLLIRDDGSKDNTLNILKKYAYNYDNIYVIEGGNIGFAASFLKLIYDEYYEKADYYAFSDQDDIWDEDKIISGIRFMCGSDSPMFYYAAQRIVDEWGMYQRDETCFRKVQRYSKYSASMVPLTRGCTQIWNSKFHEVLSAKRPDITEILAHDEWVSLIAFWKADMVYDDAAHMGYRQTGSNISGAYKNKKDYLRYVLKKVQIIMKKSNRREKIAKQFEAVFGSEKYSLLTAHYRDSYFLKIQLLLSNKYKKGLSLKWRVFNTALIVSNQL